MITLNASGGSITFEFSGNSTYLNDGTITVPVNSLALIIDESDMATFKKAASNDIFVSANVSEFGMTKAELESWFKANAVDSTGGGGKAIEAGRGISVTTGETADTVSFSLPISAGTGANSVKIGNSSNVASALFSYAEGNITTASRQSSHAEGDQTLAYGAAAHAEGFATSAAAYSHAEGMQTLANGETAHAEGYKTSATSVYSHAEGYRTITNNECEHASGQYNVSSSGSSDFGDSGNTLFSVGNGANNNSRHNAFEIRQNGDIYLSLNGQDVKLQDQLGGGGSSNLPISAGTGTNSVIVGASWNVASNSYSYAEGSSTTASGKYAHAEGSSTKASGTTSHAEGNATSATTEDAHAEGNSTLASGRKSHAEGYKTSATSNSSHAEGYYTLANGSNSHTEGYNTQTYNMSEHASGEYNVSNTGESTSAQTLFSVGNGGYDETLQDYVRHNAFEIRKNGDIYLSLNGQDVKLQDQLGGGSSYSAGTGIDITNDVISVTGMVETSAVTSAVTSGSTDVLTSGGAYEQFGGLKLVKLTESEYAALVTKDPNVLYVVIPDPSNP